MIWRRRAPVPSVSGALVLAAVLSACVARPSHVASAPIAHGEAVRRSAGRPPVGILIRDGDPSAAVAAAVVTSGIEGGAKVAVALSAVVLARLSASAVASGFMDVAVVPDAEGFRVRFLLESAGRAPAVVAALRQALVTPLVEGGPEMPLVEKKLAALAARPLPDPALAQVAECTGELFATRPLDASLVSSAPSVTWRSVEAWRSASLGLGRVALAAVGAAADVDAVACAVAASPVWPAAAPLAPVTPAPSEDLRVYDATADIPAGSARVSLVALVPEAERAVVAAADLGRPTSLLSTRLKATEPLARVSDVAATAHVGWGCLEVTLDLPSPDGSADPPVNLALAVDLAREEILAQLTSAKSSHLDAQQVANQAGDPRDAADRLAYWTVRAGAGSPPGVARVEAPPRVVSTVIGVSLPATRGESGLADRTQAIRAELGRSGTAREERTMDMRARVERGQASLWVLVASPCGTDPETDGDAGSGALGVLALAAHARREVAQGGSGSDADVDAWAATDGLGLVVHAPRRPGESAAALARRVAGVAAHGFGASLLEPSDVAGARGLLLSRRATDDTRAFAALADAVAPGHPSWLLPSGTSESLERSSNEAVRARLDALRAGPLRVAVLADEDASQGDVVLETLGAWLPRRGRPAPACPGGAAPAPARPGTYAVETSGASGAEAWLAFALPPSDASSRASAALVAAALGARGGLLERALGAGLARSWGARVFGPPKSAVLAIRIASAQGSLDAAVAEARVLFDRLRQQGLTEADRALALAEMNRDRLESSLDPEARLVALWRGETGALGTPETESIRSFTARTLRDEALIVVASRPPRAAVSKAP